MAITKRIELKEEILPNKVINLRTTTIVEEDGVCLGRSHHRCFFEPGSDVSNQPQEVQDIAAALWTEDVVNAYRATRSDD